MSDPVARACIIPPISDKLLVVSDCVKLRPDENKFNKIFLKHAINSPPVRKQAIEKSMGTTRLRIRLTELKELKIPLPPLNEQQKIAFILAKVDELIQKTDQVIERTQMLKKGLMQRLLTKGIGHNEFKTVLLAGNFIKIRIPEKWSIDPLSKIANVIDVRHYTPRYTEQGFPLILPNNVKAEGLDLDNTKFTTEDDYRYMTGDGRAPVIGDIIYSRNASFGVACRVENNKKFSLGQDLVLIKPEKINSYLLFLIMNSRSVLLQLDRLTTGSTFKRINLGLIRNFSIPYPNNPDEEKQISGIIQNVNNHIGRYKKYLQQLQLLKKELMQKLLTGKIRVKV